MNQTPTTLAAAPIYASRDTPEQRDAWRRPLEHCTSFCSALLDRLPTAIAFFDREVRYLAHNRRWKADYGLEGDDTTLLGRSHYEVFAEIPERWKALHRRVLAGETLTCDADPFPRADGRVDWVRWEVRPWYEDEDGVGGIVMITEVITDRVGLEDRLSAAMERMRLAIDGSSDGIWDWPNVSRDEMWWSPRFYTLLGYDNDGLEPSLATFRKLLHPGDRENAFARVDGALRGVKAFDIRCRLRRKDGIHAWFRARGRVSCDATGAPVRMAGSITDIGDEVSAQQDLVRQNRSMQQVVYTCSHDLKNPVITILGNTALLLEDPALAHNPDVRLTLESLEAAGKRMHDAISSMLRYCRAGKQADDGEELVDLAHVCGAVLHEHARTLDERAVEVIHPREGVLVRSDLGSVWRLVDNLVTNAVRHGLDADRPRLRIGIERCANEWRLCVEDNGPGVAPEHHDEIFGLFTSLHRADEVSGVGLAIVRQVAEGLGGRAWVESTPGFGAAFYVSFPPSRVSLGASRPEAA